MRILILLLMIGLLNKATAQSDSAQLSMTMLRLDQALLNKDSAALENLLDKKLSFGHSNGWIQNKEDVWKDLKSGKLHYGSLQVDNVQMVSLSKDLATVTMKVAAAGRAGEKEFKLNLAVMQVWKKDKKGWQLYARQSTKIE